MPRTPSSRFPTAWGNLLVNPSFNATGNQTLLAIHQCVAAGPGTYTLGGKVFIPDGQSVTGSGLVITFFSGSDCITGFLSFSSLTASTTGSFVTL